MSEWMVGYMDGGCIWMDGGYMDGGCMDGILYFFFLIELKHMPSIRNLLKENNCGAECNLLQRKCKKVFDKKMNKTCRII